MIYKVFYQETKDQSPRREQTKSLYLEVDAATELEGRIQARQLVEQTPNTISNLSNYCQTITLSMRNLMLTLPLRSFNSCHLSI